MTQEIFYEYTNHFLDNLQEHHGPKILFLDGHASRWSKAALLKLIDNKVWPCFIAPRTSIWDQPNDCGTNYSWHNCVERVVRSRRRQQRPLKVAYFNKAFCDAWQIFVSNEQIDLREHGSNTTTSTYLKSGLHPLNPCCENWCTAIETVEVLEQAVRSMQYEPTFQSRMHEY